MEFQSKKRSCIVFVNESTKEFFFSEDYSAYDAEGFISHWYLLGYMWKDEEEIKDFYLRNRFTLINKFRI